MPSLPHSFAHESAVLHRLVSRIRPEWRRAEDCLKSLVRALARDEVVVQPDDSVGPIKDASSSERIFHGMLGDPRRDCTKDRVLALANQAT